MAKGWISLHRQIREHKFYKERRVFSKYEAWIDILMDASHSGEDFLLWNERIKAERGGFVTSIVKLSKRRGWGRKKTSNFLNLLENGTMIEQKRNMKRTYIKVVNYWQYQDTGTRNEHVTNKWGTSEEQETHTINNDNNDNNVNKGEDQGHTPLQKPLENNIADQEEKKEVPPADNFDRVRRIAEKRDAEAYGKYLASVREKHTSKKTITTDGLVRRIKAIRTSMPATDLEKFVLTYAGVCNFIDTNSLHKDIYYPIRQYDLEKFLDKINSFTADIPTILGNIANHESKNKVVAIYKDKNKIKSTKVVPKQDPPKQATAPKPLTGKQKQNAMEILRKQKENLVEVSKIPEEKKEA